LPRAIGARWRSTARSMWTSSCWHKWNRCASDSAPYSSATAPAHNPGRRRFCTISQLTWVVAVAFATTAPRTLPKRCDQPTLQSTNLGALR
jgi:hypothetical protein